MSAVLAAVRCDLPCERIAESTIGGMPEARLEWHMDNYRRYMRSEDYGRDYPARSSGFVAGGNSRSFDEMADASDIRCAQAVDALVGGLAPAERAAVNHTYLKAIFPAVFRFPRGNLAELLHSGRLKIARGLIARGFY